MGSAPSSWDAGYRALQIGGSQPTALMGSGNQTELTTNAYFNSGAWKYVGAGSVAASRYSQQSGFHYWFTAAAGAANATITDFATAKMTLDQPGNLSIQSGKYIGWGNLDSLIYGDSSANFIYLRTNATEQVRIDSSGNVNVKNGNVVIGTSGKGIDFSAASNAAGATSELLNDYEEGNWVGTLRGGTTDPTTPVTSTGRYTKIGRVVTVQIAFENVNTTGASGTVYIAGLPFTNIAAIRAMGSVGVFQSVSFTETLGCIIGQSDTAISLYSFKSATGYTGATHNPTTDGYIWVNVTYTV
jgi:hypothetical protein